MANTPTRRQSPATKRVIRKLNTVTLGASSRILTDVDLDAVTSAFPRVTCKGYRRNATVAQIDAGSWLRGDTVVAADTGTPAAGTSDAIASIGSIVEYDGTSWQVILAGAASKVPAGTKLLVSAGALESPLTDASHENYIATFSGTSNTPTLTAASDGMTVLVKGEGSVFENSAFVFDTGAGWLLVGGSTSSTANPLVTFDINMGYVPGSKHINTTTREVWTCTDNGAGAAKWTAGGYGLRVAKAATVDRLSSSVATTDAAFATTFALPAAPPVGTRVTVNATLKVVTGTAGNFTPKIKIEAVELTKMTAYAGVTGDVVNGTAEFVVSAAGAIDNTGGWFNKTGGSPSNAISGGSPAVDTAVTLSAGATISVAHQWSTTDARVVDLRDLVVDCISPNIG